MGQYIQDSIKEIKGMLKECEEANKTAQAQYEKDRDAAITEGNQRHVDAPVEQAVVIRLETASGSEAPRLLKVIGVQDDYIIARGRHQGQAENFSFAHITNWRFVPYKAEEWKG